MAKRKKKRPGRPKGSKNKSKYHTGTFFTGMVGPKRPRGRPKGRKSSSSTSGLVKAKAIYVKV